MDLLKDIKDILKDDKEHNLKIEVDGSVIKVYLIYDPEGNYDESTIIPIEYSVFEEFAYISDSDYREMYNVNDYGIDFKEIILIKNIMEYLESHAEEIASLCNGYYFEYRNNDNGDDK